MKLFTIYFRKLSSKIGRVGAGSLLVLAGFAIVGTYAVMDVGAHYSGITGQTQKTTNAGCYCHCSTAASSTTVTLACSSGSSPLTTAPNTTYNFTITVASSSSSEVDGGCDISDYSGQGLTPGTGLQHDLNPQDSELTHTSPKSFGGNGYCTWNFTYTSGSTTGWDTIYATGNAVNGDGQNDNGMCEDNWNWAPKFIIHNVTPPVRMALGRSSISLGQLRVGHRIADSLKVSSNGQAAITISSSAMKSGAEFSSYPTTSNRTINAGSTEIDSVIFTPASRGSFNDSLIFNTNSDTVPEQRMGLYVSGQGIQAIFNSTYGNSLTFGNLRAGHTSQQTFSFSNTGDDTLFLQTPSISGSGFTIATGLSTLIYPPNQSGSVVVQFAPTGKQSYSGSLVFTASNEVSGATVSLSGTGILPEIQVSNSNYLGDIRVGQTLQGNVTLKNVGNDTLHLSNVSLTQPSTRFSLGAYDQAVIPGGNDTVPISYTPNAEKYDTASLQFSTDDPSNATVAISIIGNGTLPHMSITENGDTVNLGEIKVNSFSTTNIGITNNGAANLNITSASAGPVPFVLDQSPNVVTAGTTSNIIVGFSPTATGVFTGKLVVSGDDPNNPTDTVYLSGTGINTALSIDPGSVNFGQVPILTTAFDTITLSDSGKANVNIYSTQLSPSTGVFAIVGTTPSVVTASGSAIIVLSFKPDSAIGYSASLTLTTDDANAPTRTININGTGLKDAFSITPSPLAFGQVPILTAATDTIRLSNAGTSAITISNTQLSSASGAFALVGSAPTQVSAGGTAPIIVRFHPDTAGSYSGSLTLTTSDPSIPIRTVAISGTGIKGSLSINPSQINFGNVIINHDSTIQATLKNSGLASMSISSIVLTGPSTAGFSDGSFTTPQTIPAGNSITMNLGFAPTVAGSYSGNVQLTLQDGSMVNIPLQGVAENTAGVTENSYETSQISFSLSPNPAGSSLNVHASIGQTNETRLEVFDASGRQMISLPLGILSQGEHDIQVPTESLPNGSYFIRISNSNGNAAETELIVNKE
jgi:hypothetical protein